MGDAIASWQVAGLTDPHAEAMHPMSARANEDRPLLTDQPGAEPAALKRKAGLAEQLARVVADQIAEQSQRGALRLRSPAPSIGFTPRAPRRACRWSTAIPCPRKIAETGNGERLDPDQQRGRQPEGDDDPDAP